MNSLGLHETEKAEDADLIIANTCSVRQHAEDRVYGLIRNWQKIRTEKPNLIIAITGCMPGRDKDGKLKNKIKGVDLFFGISEMMMLPNWLRELNPDLICHREAEAHGNLLDYLTITPQRKNNFQIFVTIQTGCNNFCTYCVVPYARGKEINRPIKDILKEIKLAVGKGCVEVTLLGQVVNNYKAPDPESFCPDNSFRNQDGFAALLWEINQINGVERLHWTAADPQYFSNAQVEALKLPKQLNYLHLPVQSGDNEILQKMNRKYTREKYIELIEKIREARPDIAIGTDLIVGFCGETESQFQNTLDLYKQCDFDISYQAMYSERSGTAAAKAFKDDVPQAEKKKRWEAIQELMEATAFRKNQKFLNRNISVLVEDYYDGICSGHSREMKFMQFLGNPDLIGKIINVKIQRPETWVLRGELND